MTHTTPNITINSAALALRDNTRITIIDNDTDAATVDLTVSNATLFIMDSDDEVCSNEVHSDEVHVVTDNIEYTADTVDTTDTVNTDGIENTEDTVDGLFAHTIEIKYDDSADEYVNTASYMPVDKSQIATVFKYALGHNARVYITLNMPGIGLVDFFGKLYKNYGGIKGITLQTDNGGLYILDGKGRLDKDLKNLQSVTFAFSG